MNAILKPNQKELSKKKTFENGAPSSMKSRFANAEYFNMKIRWQIVSGSHAEQNWTECIGPEIVSVTPPAPISYWQWWANQDVVCVMECVEKCLNYSPWHFGLGICRALF